MFSIPPISLATLQKLVFIVFAACAPLFLFLRGKMLHRLRLARQMAGPSLWELATVHARHLLGSDFHTYLHKLTVQYDYKPWSFRKGLDLLVVISDADTIGAAFKSKNLAAKTEKLYGGLRDHLGKCSIVLNGPEWKARRTAINPAFNKAFVESNLDVMYEEAVACAQKVTALAGKTDTCIQRVVEAGIVGMSIRSIVGATFSDESTEEFIWTVGHAQELVLKKYMNFIRFCFEQRFSRSERELFARMYRIRDGFKERVRDELIVRVQDESNSEDPFRTPTLVDFLIGEMIKKKSLTESEIISETMLVIVASIETTTTAQLATLYMLALHPDIQSRVAKEIRDIFGQSDRPITPDDLSRMEYLERVIKESMRLFPPGPLFLRTADGETNLNGTVVPEGSTVIFNISTLHRNPNFFKDPMKFNPDRFSPGAQEERHPYAYLPFSSGARNCVGRLHAMIMMKTLTSTFLRRFKILPGRGMNSIEDIKTKYAFVLHLTENPYVHIVPL